MTTFRIGFDGPAIRDGEIDVADLAPALLALGDIFENANAALNQDRANAKLKIRASERGSFVALLSLDVSFITDMLDAVSANPDRITAAEDLLGLIIQGGKIVGGTAVGLFVALRFLKGGKPDSSAQNEDGTTSITKGGTTIIVDSRTARLLTDYPTREATKTFVNRALRSEGVTTVSFTEDDAAVDHDPELTLTKSDIASVEIPEPDDDQSNETRSEREVLLRIVSAQFAEGYKWRFTDGTNTFTAEMRDEDFKRRLENAEIALSKQDTLRCLIEEVQWLSGSQLKTETSIIQVREHISGAKQLKLFE